MLRTVSTTRYYLLVIFLTGLFFTLHPAFTHAQVIPGDPGNFITTWEHGEPGDF